MNRHHDKTAEAVLQLLEERWPACFAVYEQRHRPLKVGIHDDIIAALDGAVTTKELTVALRMYVSNLAYLKSVKEGAPRIGLDGKPAGKVTQPESEYAERLVHWRRAEQLEDELKAKKESANKRRRLPVLSSGD